MQIDRFPFRAMACDCEIVLGYEVQQFDAALITEIAHKAMLEVRRIESKYSRYRSDSVISRINQAAGIAPVECDVETWSLLNYADTLYQSSEGLFDVTAGVLRQAWQFSEPRLPSQTAITALCELINWPAVVREHHQHHIFLPRTNMEIDFGGFGKEYASDRAAKVLLDEQLQFGYVNLGGDIRVIGPKPDGQAWQIGIQDPRSPQKLIATISIESGALATSGDYQRFFDLEGRRYCHILNPRTGWPVHHWRSITAIAPLATMAGSCTTIAMLKQQQAVDFLQKAGVDYFAIDRDGQVYKNH